MSSSSLVLRPMVETDLLAYDRILHSAFDSGIMPLFYPNGYRPADRTWSLKMVLKKLRHDPVVHYMVVVDTALDPLPQDLEPLPSEVIDPEKLAAIAETAEHQQGRPVGVAVWKIYPHDRGADELAAEAKKAQADGFPPNANTHMMEAFFGTVSAAKRKHLDGRAFVLLDILATDPDHHRRGVGAVQLKWGLAEADKLRVPAYLEASKMGRPLYARYGFEGLEPLDFDARPYGGPEDIEHTLMLRPAKTAA
ncbi:hypothetical protein MBLNU459_g0247t1 [Dothideomycetes sp. NU459]